MTILDRYIVRQFVMTVIFGLITFLLIFVVIDMMEHLDDFIDANAPVGTIIQYYLAFTPEIIKLMTPVAMLLGALFVVGRMTNQNELPAMKSSGMSLYRFLAPFVIVALVVSILSIYFNGWIVPYANQKKAAIERAHLHPSQGNKSTLPLFFQDGKTRLVSINFYESARQVGYRVSVEEFSDTNATVLRRRYDARQMEWGRPWKSEGDSTREGWILVVGSVREFDGDKQQITPFDRLPLGKLSISPADIEKKQRKPDEMDYPDLREFIQNQVKAGQDVSRWMVDYHNKIAFPFASVIVVLFGVPFASIKRRSGIAIDFGVCVAVTFIYLGFMKTSQVFGYNGDLNPLFTAWLANIIFLVLAVINLLRVQK
ncbi:MAG TPA: LPS export ABC transporter permease LptG [Bacteroidota bacterium]|nr:LPS export ABC transporter permease LptG [Bacteroidota bacterium]